MFPAPPSCCELINLRCGRFAMASPSAKEVWARTPKIWRTFCELRYSTTVSAMFVSAMVSGPPYMIGLISSGRKKKQPYHFLIHRLHVIHQGEEAFGQRRVDIDGALRQMAEHQRAEDLSDPPDMKIESEIRVFRQRLKPTG